MAAEDLSLDSVRNNAIGKSLSPEELNMFSAGWEEERMIPTRHGETHVYLYGPEKGTKKYPVIINLHGGGFVKGHRDQDVVFCRNLVQNAGYVVVDVDYHTAPEHMYPYALEECYDVVNYVCTHEDEFCADAGTLVIMGHSAGGTLTCGVEFMALKTGAFRPSLLIPEYLCSDSVKDPGDYRYAYAPFIRVTVDRMRRYADWYIAPEHRHEITASPVLASKEELSGFAPVLMILAEYDSMTADSIRFAANLIDAGVTVQAKVVRGAGHGFTVQRKKGYEVAEKLIFTALKKLKKERHHD